VKFKKIKKASFLITLLCLVFPSASAFASGKISASPNPITLNEGSSQTVTISLNAPIISGSGTPYLNINFTSSDPSHVSFSPSTVAYSASDWSQNQTLIVNTVDDGIYNNGEYVTITATADSNSVYYEGFVVTIPLTINNIDLPPAPSLTNQTISLSRSNSNTTNVVDGVVGNPDVSSLSIVSAPAHGNTSVSNGTILYTPNSSFVGDDSLAYSLCSIYDSSVCSSADIFYQVTAVGDPAPDTGYGQPKNNNLSNILGTSLFVWSALVLYKISKKYISN